MNNTTNGSNAKTIKIIVCVVALMLAVITAVALIAAFVPSSVRDDTALSEVTDIEAGSEVSDGNGQVYESGAVYVMPANMLFTQVSALSETASEGITVKATVKPDTAVNKSVIWQVSWDNPEAEFAAGKDAADYLIATPQSVGSNVATITCLQPFGATIKVAVISETDPGVFAILTVDYEKRITGVTAIQTNEDYSFNGTSLVLDATSGWTNSEKNYTDNWELTYTYGVGSADTSAITSKQYYVKASSELAAAYSSANTEYTEMKDNRSSLLESGLGVSLFRTSIDKTKDPIYQIGSDGEKTPVFPTITTFNSTQWNKIVAAFDGLSGYAFDMKIVLTNANGRVSEVNLQISVDKGAIGAQAESITLDQTNLVL